MDSTMMTLNNNSTKLDKYGYDNPSSDNSMKNGGGLPSFHDILWCPDVDGDVMDTTGMGGAMVRSVFFQKSN
jgi:hypothetical protein